MRPFYAFAFLLVSLTMTAVTGLTAPPPAPAVSMEPTVYDDGRSCPNDCDAHVVFHPRHNGTRNAFDPSSPRSAPQKCVAGRPCRICFSEAESSCTTATYRGAGPPPRRFDFTPAFYEQNCEQAGLPPPLAAQCRAARSALPALESKVNCVATPEHERCRAMMQAAARRKAEDDRMYEECLRVGETRFNRDRPRSQQRSLQCAYEKFGTGHNSSGVTWKRLLDGACRPGTYAGRDGLDCCTGSLYEAALLGRECALFFVTR
ncbi:MAG TPA: hypothetical protein VF659_11120 [Pyrinomonadaceae bacterium]|jgi:hypothetical protein